MWQNLNMKRILDRKILWGLAIFACGLVGFSACDEEKAESVEKESVQESENVTENGEKSESGLEIELSDADSKFLQITGKMAGQLADGNFASMYIRMNESYRTIYSQEEFAAMGQNFLDAESSGGESSGEKIKVDFSQDQGGFYTYCQAAFPNGKYVTVAFNPDSDYPVMIIFKKYVDSGAETLREICEDNFKIGCGMTGYSAGNSAMNHEEYTELAAFHFSSATSTNLMKPSSILVQSKSIENAKNGDGSPVLDFSNVDPILSWAQENDVNVRGHTLVWHTQAPDWFFKEGYKSDGELVDRETMISRADSFIGQYLTYCQENYPGVVYCWDVVNEAVDPAGGDSESFFRCRTKNGDEKNLWYYTIGSDYPEVAFKIARKYAADGVKLFYNDYSTTDATKRNYIYKLCEDLKSKGLIDGIGMQSYWDLKNPTLLNIRRTLEKYGELGLELQLTEWSIPVNKETEEEFNLQAERYGSIFRLLKKLDTSTGGPLNITCVSSFGLVDHYPYYSNDTNNTRWWDCDYEPKASFYAIADSLGFE